MSHDRLSCSLPRSVGKAPLENSAALPKCAPTRAAATAPTRSLIQKSHAPRVKVTPRYGMSRQSSEPMVSPPSSSKSSGALSPPPPREHVGCRPANGVDKGCRVASGVDKSFAGAVRQSRFPSSSPRRVRPGQGSSPSQTNRQTSSGCHTARLSFGRSEVPHIVTARASIGTPEVPHMKGPRMPFGHPCHQHLRNTSAPPQPDAYIKVGVRGGSLCVPHATKFHLDKATIYKSGKN